VNSPVNDDEDDVIEKLDYDDKDKSFQVKSSAHIKKYENTLNKGSSHQETSKLSADDEYQVREGESKWLGQWPDEGNEVIDFTSDVSACCSEDKDMTDFDEEGLSYLPEHSIHKENYDSIPESSDAVENLSTDTKCGSGPDALNGSQTTNHKREFSDSNSTTRDSDSKSSVDPSVKHILQATHDSVTQFIELKNASINLTSITSQICADEDLIRLSNYNLANLAEQGKTLLWDLLQDGKIEHLSPNLHIEVENVLVNLVMSSGDRFIRYKFIEACLENLSKGVSVIISLRLLPRLMSFNTLTRNVSIPAVNETYTIVLWAEREHNMSKNFFRNLVEDYHKRKLNVETRLSNKDSSYEEDISSPLFSHFDAIITRMSFLTFIYSKTFSPVSMGLTKDQMDQLWECLASDLNSRCSDVLFQWIIQQAVGEDLHGVDDELLDYILKSKLPSLAPESFRLRGLKLLEQLLWIRQDYECCHELEHPATRLLWDIALKACDDEVSMAAIRILNHFYIYTNHQKPIACKQGTNFMRYCMEHLRNSFQALKSATDKNDVSQSLDVMQKVILLIRTHLEVFKAHWSYFLRVLQLNNEADLTSHRMNAYDIKLSMTIRLVCQAASSVPKTTIEMQVSDIMGELRAEIVKWWFSQVDRGYFEQSPKVSPASSLDSLAVNAPKSGEGEEQSCTSQTRSDHELDKFTVFLLNNYHSLRLLSHNQEIPFDWDERQINELDFKDMQVIYVLSDIKLTNVDSADDLESNKSVEDSNTPARQYPNVESIPCKVLQDRDNFELLMEADRYLGSFHRYNLEIANKSKNLSRRVWEIIQLLPTSLNYKEHLKRCGSSDEADKDWTLRNIACSQYMSASCPQRLLYSLQIIDILRSSHEIPLWANTFIRKGGLSDLYDVFMSQKLLPEDNEDWNEWLQECLAYLLKLLFQFGTKPIASPSSSDAPASSTKSSISNPRIVTSGVKRLRRSRYKISNDITERVMIPSFSEELLVLLEDTTIVFDKLLRILKSSALCRGQNDQYYYVTMSSRAMIVNHVLSFLSSWCKSDPNFPEFEVENYKKLIKALILDDPDPSSRREACNGLFKLHYACTTRFLDTALDTSSSTNVSDSSLVETGSLSSVGERHSPAANNTLSADLLACLVRFLPITERMMPPKPLRSRFSETDYIKELNSPGCKDYFWLTCQLIDAPNTCRQINSDSKCEESLEGSQSSPEKLDDCSFESDGAGLPLLECRSPVDLQELCRYLVIAIRTRPVFETRDYSVEDDTLRGMLMMMVMAIRRDPSFRYSRLAGEFIKELYDYLFATPTEKNRFLPKCKSGPTRSTAFDLMLALVEYCPKNYMRLLDLLLQDQHQAIIKAAQPTEYWPHDESRSEVGFVGLINLGATCYLATCMQHLFMIPDLRYAILSIKDTKNLRHGDILRELQKIFAFLLESERKAYNPRNFCKVYTMDNHPLNIAEQTDMTEFLTDLITKLEESSPGLKNIIKNLFSGTLSNNVVSLDCPHISRTTEEFYTLRVQVADMRNLNDSLDELTVRDTLEGDNMYTCSTCEKKVRAEKRACIVKLPRILCFNTMRYTFNMATMTKEKVNTHFSFPLKLDMSDYLEANLMRRQSSSSSQNGSMSSRDSFNSDTSSPHEDAESRCKGDDESISMYQGLKSCRKGPHPKAENDEMGETLYELIGVTVHTGNADGGHYYCFIRDCEDQTTEKPRWYLFNDAEVKPFDDSHIGTECYGGELTTKSYDAINDRFMDFSIEKTNSAYMLFYKRVDYEFRSKSVAIRYLESDIQRNLNTLLHEDEQPLRQPKNLDVTIADGSTSPRSPITDTKHLKCEHEVSGTIDPSIVIDSNNGHEQIDLDFGQLSGMTYADFVLPRHLANWVWNDNMRFSRDQYIYEHNYFDFIWQICANISRTVAASQKSLVNIFPQTYFQVSEDTLAIETSHLSILFVLGVLMNSRERPNLANWTELIRKQFTSSRAACDWLMQLIDDEDTWLKQMLQRCPIEMVRQLFHRLCSDLTGPGKQHKKLRLIK